MIRFLFLGTATVVVAILSGCTTAPVAQADIPPEVSDVTRG